MKCVENKFVKSEIAKYFDRLENAGLYICDLQTEYECQKLTRSS